jgi:hypothetical protein
MFFIVGLPLSLSIRITLSGFLPPGSSQCLASDGIWAAAHLVDDHVQLHHPASMTSALIRLPISASVVARS